MSATPRRTAFLQERYKYRQDAMRILALPLTAGVLLLLSWALRTSTSISTTSSFRDSRLRRRPRRPRSLEEHPLRAVDEAPRGTVSILPCDSIASKTASRGDP